MKKLSFRILHEDSAILTFEWILLITVLVIGIVGGLSCVRDAYVWELGGVTGAIVALDLSYLINHPVLLKTTAGEGAPPPIFEMVSGTAVGTKYEYTPPEIFYRPRGGGQVGDGSGMLQEGGTPAEDAGTSVPHQTVIDNQNQDTETGIYIPS